MVLSVDSFPETASPLPESVDEVMPPPLDTKATMAVPSLSIRRPAGNWSTSWNVVPVPSASREVSAVADDFPDGQRCAGLVVDSEEVCSDLTGVGS